MNIHRAALVLGLLGVTLAGCGGGNTSSTRPSAELTTIEVSAAVDMIPSGLTNRFTAMGTFSDGSNRDISADVAWATTDTAIAVIDSAGLATGLRPGSAAATATLDSVSGSTTLTVGPPVLLSITVTPVNAAAPSGIAEQLNATANYSDGSKQDITPSVTWESQNSAVAAIDNKGVAIAVNAGTSTITATLNSVIGNTLFTVTSPVLDSLRIIPNRATIPPGLGERFNAVGTYSDGTSRDISSSVQWRSQTTSIATINNTGVAAALTAGSVVVTATLAGVSSESMLTVSDATLKSIAVTPSAPSMVDGTSQQFRATGIYSDNATYDITGAVSWKSDNMNAMTVSSSGLVAAVGAGQSKIAATFGSTSGWSDVTNIVACLP